MPKVLDTATENRWTAWESSTGAEPPERSFSLRFAGIIGTQPAKRQDSAHYFGR